MRMAIGVATMRRNPVERPGEITECERLYFTTPAPGDIALATANAVEFLPVHVRYNTPLDNRGVVGSYDTIYRFSDEEILCFLHDDVVIRERGWDQRVLKEFDDPQVGLVGFGGALQQGVPELYKVPYRLQDLVRVHYRSNVDDAEAHGERFTGSCDVAVLDGFCLIARRQFIRDIGGFSWIPECANYFNYDYALCAMARRYHYRIRLVGVLCHHRGGATSVGDHNPHTTQEKYNEAHRWFYDTFRDVLPCKV